MARQAGLAKPRVERGSKVQRARQQLDAEVEIGSTARRSARHSGVVDDLLELDERQGARSNPRVAVNGKLIGSRDRGNTRRTRSGPYGQTSARVETHLSAQRQKVRVPAVRSMEVTIESARTGRRGSGQVNVKPVPADETRVGIDPPRQKPRRARHCSSCGLPLSEHNEPCDPRQVEKDAEKDAQAATQRAKFEASRQKARYIVSNAQGTQKGEDVWKSAARLSPDHLPEGYLDAMEEEASHDDETAYFDRDVEMSDELPTPVRSDQIVHDEPVERSVGAQPFEKAPVAAHSASHSVPFAAYPVEHVDDADLSASGRPEDSTAGHSHLLHNRKDTTPPDSTASGGNEHNSSVPESNSDSSNVDDEDDADAVTEDSMRTLARALANGQVLNLSDVSKLRRSLEHYDGSSKPPVDMFLIARDKLHSRYHVKTYTHPLAGGVKATPNGAVELPLSSTSERKLRRTTYADRKKHRHERFNAFAQKGDALAAAEEDEAWVFAYAVPKSGAGELREWTSPAVRADAPRLPNLIRKTIFDHLNPHREQAVREREAKEQAWQQELLKVQSQNKAAEERNAALQEQIVNMQRDHSRIQKQWERHEAKRQEKREARKTAKLEELRVEEAASVAAAAKKARARAARDERRLGDA